MASDELFTVRKVRTPKRGPGADVWQVIIEGAGVDQTTVIASYNIFSKAEDHCTRLNAANVPEPVKGPFVAKEIIEKDGDERYGVFAHDGGDGDDDTEVYSSHNEYKCARLRDLLNELVAAFLNGDVT